MAVPGSRIRKSTEPVPGTTQLTPGASTQQLETTKNRDQPAIKNRAHSHYDRLIGEGKAHKVALTAVMRKLVILANVLVRDDRNWTAIAPEPSVG